VGSKIKATIRVDVEEMRLLDLKDFAPFQGKLKELSKENYTKLRKQIETLGFSEPVSVWKNGTKTYILNGHQRLRTLQVMAGEGVDIPKIPAVYVRAKDKAEAKRKVLALTSQFGNMTTEGLFEFATEAGIAFQELADNFRFPEIDFKKYQEEFYDEKDKEVEGEVEFSEFIGEMNNYIVLVFNNDMDWTAAQSFFEIKTKYATRTTGKEWSKGVGRIVDGSKIMKVIT